MAQPSCVHCVHYFVTYEPSQPHGCRAMGFKSRQNPALVVLRSSGSSCQMFRKKNKAASKTPETTPGKGGIVA